MAKKIRTSNEFWDRERKEKDRFAKEALSLFRRILDLLDTAGFTLHDVKQSLCWDQGRCKSEHRCPTTSHLRFLVENGFLVFEECSKTYAVREEMYFFLDRYEVEDAEREETDDELGAGPIIMY